MKSYDGRLLIRVVLIALLALFLVVGAFNLSYAEELSSGIGSSEDTEQGGEQEDSEDDGNWFEDFNVVDEDSFKDGIQAMKPFTKVVSSILSAGYYIIFCLLVVTSLLDVFYITLPFTRRLLGGANQDAPDQTPSLASMGAGMGMGMRPMGMTPAYGANNMANNPGMFARWSKMFSSTGIVSDDAKRVVRDPIIAGTSSKLGHYIISRIVVFIMIGACVILLISSSWFNFGLNVGEFVLEKFSELVSSLKEAI